MPANLDAAVAQQALQAGVSVEVLKELAGVIGNKMAPRSGKVIQKPVPQVESSDESEEEEATDLVQPLVEILFKLL